MLFSGKITCSKSRHINSVKVLIIIVGFIELPKTVTCFNVCSPFISSLTLNNNLIHHSTSSSSRLAVTESTDGDISSEIAEARNLQIAKSRKLLEETKAKMAARAEAVESTEVVEEMAMDVESPIGTEKRTKLTKSIDDESGLIRTDGELMAAMSEAEDWEIRDLFDCFEDELEESDLSKQLRERDVAASLYGLRVRMQNEDYSKIFNKKNYWIGEF